MDIEFEKAVRILIEYMPESEVGSRKPILFHGIRVGVSLYRRGYPREVVLSGLLHDALEWSDMSEEALKDEFGENILSIVLANTKDRSIDDSTERIDDMIKRCVTVGESALIVKAADTIDSFEHYTRTGNTRELEGHCQKIAGSILRQKPDTFRDPIFEELRTWMK